MVVGDQLSMRRRRRGTGRPVWEARAMDGVGLAGVTLCHLQGRASVVTPGMAAERGQARRSPRQGTIRTATWVKPGGTFVRSLKGTTAPKSVPPKSAMAPEHTVRTPKPVRAGDGSVILSTGRWGGVGFGGGTVPYGRGADRPVPRFRRMGPARFGGGRGDPPGPTRARTEDFPPPATARASMRRVPGAWLRRRRGPRRRRAPAGGDRGSPARPRSG
jgi:hypothetical protein